MQRQFPIMTPPMPYKLVPLLLLFLSLSVVTIWAEEWQPTEGLIQIPIWPAGKIPDPQPLTGPESYDQAKNEVGGRPWHAVAKVSVPTMTVYPAKGENPSDASVIIYPGGGYWVLAMDLEGEEVCDWLTSVGVTCILLKYRVPGTDQRELRAGPYPKSPVALQDAQRTIGLVRHNASKWNLNPNRIGVLGFSAGGHLVVASSTEFQRVYEPVDEADKTSCRPDFAVAVYPGHLTWMDEQPLKLRPYIKVPKETPPTFLLHAQNDDVDPVEYSLAYYLALKRADVPVEMHLYATGGHAFGLRQTEMAVTEWPQLVERWLFSIQILSDSQATNIDSPELVLLEIWDAVMKVVGSI